MDILLSVATSDKTVQGTITMAQTDSRLIGLNYSREHEGEADIYGVDYIAPLLICVVGSLIRFYFSRMLFPASSDLLKPHSGHLSARS